MPCFLTSNMFSSKCSVFLFFLLASAVAPSCLSSSHDSLPFQPQECIHEHFSALLQLKRGFSFDDFDYSDVVDPDLSSWNPDKRDCCAWEGITCDRATGHVTILDLSDFHLSGAIDFQSLSQLGSLQILNLAYNNFDPSPIPPAIGQLHSLTHLNLSFLRLYGEIPMEMSNLTRLVSLDLSFDLYLKVEKGSIGALIQNMSTLRQLFLDYVDMSNGGSEWSSAISSALPNLHELSMEGCGLSGPIHPSFFHLPVLSQLDLSYNNLLFSELDFIGNLSSLTSLSLGGLLGKFPAKIWKLPYLSELDISRNDISSALLLDSIGELSSLTSLRLSYCILHVRFSATNWRLYHLSELDLTGSDISSSDLNFIGNLSSLRSLMLYDCGLDGRHLDKILRLPFLTILDASFNDFSFINLNMVGNFSSFKSLTQLLLQSCSMSGPLPTWLGNLSRLEILDFSRNSFSGFIPSSYEKNGLLNLKKINLDDNLLNGTIPSSLFSLPSLRSLSLSSNQLGGQLDKLHDASSSSSLEYIGLMNNKLQGRIPSLPGSLSSALGNFSKLEHLDLSSNSFSGKIHSLLFSLPSLRYLSLRNNHLNGQLDEFHNASSSSLSYIDLSDNKLQGMIPRSIFQLRNLKYIYLFSNNFNDTLDLALFQNLSKLTALSLSNINVLDKDDSSNSNLFPQLSILVLSSCNIKTFPNFLRNQWRLTYLDLSNNKISGEIPKWIWKVGNGLLKHLNLSHNALQAIGMSTFNLSLSNLNVLDLSSNVLQSLLPISLYDLEFYSVSNNSLSGEIPESICNLTYLRVLDISHNKFSGHIPQCVGEISNRLEMLNLQGNAFIGSMPQTFKKDCSLQILDFSANQFQGQLPMSIANCKGLRVLNVRCNKINDTFPLWIQGLPNLSILVLKYNNFHGSLKISPNFTSKLQIFDLSSNNFTGNLPSTMFWRWKEMASKSDSQPEYLFDFFSEIREGSKLSFCGLFCDTVLITSKNIEMALTKIYTAITMVDLSNNHFQGPIPESIGSLMLLRGLNLSHNKFIGRIPISLKNLTLLESLDLSKNNISGQIPPELLDLTFLEVLDLSWNQLSGSIPYGKQFFTFTNKSFEGNSKLCGLPLSKECESINDAPPWVAKNVKLLSEGEYDWKMVALGFGIGYGVGVGGFCWTLVLWRKGRRVYNRYVYKMLVLFFPHVL